MQSSLYRPTQRLFHSIEGSRRCAPRPRLVLCASDSQPRQQVRVRLVISVPCSSIGARISVIRHQYRLDQVCVYQDVQAPNAALYVKKEKNGLTHLALSFLCNIQSVSAARNGGSPSHSSGLDSHDTNHPVYDGVVGVLGGGQLGRMMAEAANCLAVNVAVLDPSDHPSAAFVTSRHHQGSFRDEGAVSAFAESVNVLTVEIEHVDVDALRHAQDRTGVPVHPL